MSLDVKCSEKKRLVIYSFFDKKGIVDRYVGAMLQGLFTVSDRIVIVSNGAIPPQSRSLFKKYTDDIIVRENKGFDIWGYKTAIDTLGWSVLQDYYEVVLMNDTLMGPVYPFEEMFNAMNKRPELDFWGISVHTGISHDFTHCNPYGSLPEHIQSFFMVYRNKFLKSNELKDYWDNLPQLSTYEEAIGKYETFFTKHFADMGFRWDIYIKTPYDGNFSDYYLLKAPRRAIEKDLCPVFKRRSFFHDQDDFLFQTMGEQSLELFNYLRDNTDYDTDMILENLIRTCHQSDFVRTLGLYYVLPEEYLIPAPKTLSLKIALVIHLYYIDLIDETLHCAAAMPLDADIYVNTPHKQSAEKIKESFNILPNNVFVRVIPNRGRDVSSFAVGTADIAKKYDLICFYHDKKGTQTKPYTIGSSFSYLLNKSSLASSQYVQNVIQTFAQNKYLGLLANIPPHNGPYFPTLGCEWGPNFENTRQLHKKLRLKAPISAEKPPICPMGTVFWFRTEAMKKLFDYKWEYEDFPLEPNGIDGTLLHAFERIYSYVVQDAGFYPAYVMPSSLAKIQLVDFTYYIREFNKIFTKHGAQNFFYVEKQILDNLFNSPDCPITMRNALKFTLKRKLSPTVYERLVKIKRAIFH